MTYKDATSYRNVVSKSICGRFLDLFLPLLLQHCGSRMLKRHLSRKNRCLSCPVCKACNYFGGMGEGETRPGNHTNIA